MINQNRLPILDTVADLKTLGWQRWSPNKLSGKSGVYCIYDIENEVIAYVGTSNELGRRINEHIYSGKYIASRHEIWVVIENDEMTRLLIESRVISLCKPAQNKRNQRSYWKKLTEEEIENEMERAYRAVFD